MSGWGSGFCTFNGLVAIALLMREGLAERIGILDLDAHYGDGTDECLARVPDLKPHIDHWTFGCNVASFSNPGSH